MSLEVALGEDAPEKPHLPLTMLKTSEGMYRAQESTWHLRKHVSRVGFARASEVCADRFQESIGHKRRWKGKGGLQGKGGQACTVSIW